MPSLPTQGGSSGTWGTQLNEFLSVSLNASGTLKNREIVVAAVGDGVADDTADFQAAFTAAALVDGTVRIPSPAVTYRLTSTVDIVPASGSQVRLSIISECSWAEIEWAGGNNDSVFHSYGWKDSTITGVKVAVPTGKSGVVVWDIDDEPVTYGSSGNLTFINCHSRFSSGATGCVGFRGGHSGGNDISFVQFLGCTVHGNALVDANIGWVVEHANVLNWTFYAGGGSYLAKLFTTSPTAGAVGSAGGADHWFYGCAGSYFTTVFEFTTAGPYGIFGGRFEHGDLFVDALAGGSGVASVEIINAHLTGWFGDGSGRVFRQRIGGSLEIVGCLVSKDSGTFDANMITVGATGGRDGYLRVSGSFMSSDPVYTISEGDWLVDMSGVTLIDSSFVNQGRPVSIGQERDQLALNGRGLLTESFPIVSLSGSATMPTQVVYGHSVGLRKGDVVSKIVLGINVAAGGTDPTLARLGLANSAGVVLARTADVKAAAGWASGFRAFDLSAAYTILADGLYYPVVLINGTWGTTQPTFARTQPASQWTAAYGANAPVAFQWSGQTDLPAVSSPLTITAGVSTGTGYWIAVA